MPGLQRSLLFKSDCFPGGYMIFILKCVDYQFFVHMFKNLIVIVFQTKERLLETKEKSEQQKRIYETITSTSPDLMYVFDLSTFWFTLPPEA